MINTCTKREPDDIDDPDNPVIIAGYGRFGQIVSRLLKASGYIEGMYKLSEVWGDDHEVGLGIRQNLEDLKVVLKADRETSGS